jgi:hypothetical protein
MLTFDYIKTEGIHEVSHNQPDSISGEVLNVEFYTRSEVIAGNIHCPIGFRLLDFFNSSSDETENLTREFIEFLPVENNPQENAKTELKIQYVRKSSIYVIALTDAESGRGLGARDSLKTYPYVYKNPRAVSIEMEGYSVAGTAYVPQGQTFKELLNERNQFIPLTDVTLARDNHLYGTRPLCILNKQQIIFLKE